MIKKILLTVFAAIGLLCLGALGYVKGWHIKKMSLEELVTRLEPHVAVALPDSGQAPYPVVLAFHGCRGILEGNHEWVDSLTRLGFAVLMPNSFGFREVDPLATCKGYALLGQERAGDVLATLAIARKNPKLDTSRMVLIGWSHGSWSIMDALAMPAKGSKPTNLKKIPGHLFSGVKAMSLIYPYCGFPAHAAQNLWAENIPAQFILVENDATTPETNCEAIIEKMQQKGMNVKSILYQNVEHGFTERSTREVPAKPMYPEQEKDAFRNVLAFFQEIINIPGNNIRMINKAN